MDAEVRVSGASEDWGDTILLGECLWRSSVTKEDNPVELIDEAKNREEIAAILRDTTGFFTIITDTTDGVAICTDFVSSIPLNYTISDGKCYIFDDHRDVFDIVADPSTDPTSEAEYRGATYVTGHHSLLNSVYQTEGASIVEVTERGITRDRYFDGVFDGEKKTSYEDYISTVDSIITNLVDYADGRPIWLSLSGGYDSRLLALALKKSDYGNVVTYSYGLENNIDSETSKQIAEDIGLEWNFVEYSPDKWQEWYGSDARQRMDESFWLNSTLPLASWAAVRELRENEIMPADAVVVTGHTGDVLAGSHIPIDLQNEEYVSESQFADRILDKHYGRNDFPDVELDGIRKRILSVTGFSGGNGREAIAHADKWDLFERQTKHLSLIVKTFEHENMDWWLPFFDAENIEFWTEAALQDRLEQRSYRGYVDQLYEDVTGSESPERAKRGSSPAGKLLEKAKEVAKLTPFDTELRRLYNNRIQRERWAYDGMNSDPRGVLTVMEFDRYKELYNGDIGLASYRARELLGDVKLQDYQWDPPINTIADKDGPS